MVEREAIAYGLIAILTVATGISVAVWTVRGQRTKLRQRGIKTWEKRQLAERRRIAEDGIASPGTRRRRRRWRDG